MGGTKCQFRKCTNNSANSPNLHFFNFPVKNVEKFSKWVKYSDAKHIMNLNVKQARNATVCQQHFRTECFMNYKKNSLIKSAVPTLVILEENQAGRIALDYEASDNPEPTFIPATTLKHLLPPPNSVEGDFKETNDSKKETFSFPELNGGKIKIEKNIFKTSETNNLNVNLLNEGIQSQILIPYKCVSKRLNNSDSTVINTKLPKLQNAKLSKSRLNEAHSINFSINIPSAEDDDIEIVDFQNKQNLEQNHKPKLKTEAEHSKYSVSPVSCDSQRASTDLTTSIKTDIDAKSKLTVNEKQAKFFQSLIKQQELQYQKSKTELELKISNLQSQLDIKKNELEEYKMKMLQVSKQETKETSFHQSHAPNKEHLFQSIKKYLCPAMTTLLRMEMFGNPERAWLDDEKDISVELLNLGSPIFSYFRDEWRFRLPPQKDVESWKNKL